MEIKVIERRDIILNVRDRWNGQYPKDDYLFASGERAWQVRARIAELDLSKAQPGEVDKAIGVVGWADNDCDLCGSNEERLLRIGEKPDYEARWVDLCPSCLAKAASSLAPSLEQE